MLMGRENQLLAALPTTLYEKWESAFSVRELKRGQPLDLGGRRREVFFPTSCVLSVYTTNSLDGRTFMRFVGSSFTVGLVNMMSVEDLFFDGVVCGAGYAIAIPSEVILRSIDTSALSGRAQSVAMSRTARGGLMIAQCFGSHSNKQRLARLLLQARDCYGAGHPIMLTQQSLGEMLMARRETTAEILSEWNSNGIVESRRGAIRICNVDALKQARCDRYSWIQ